MQSNFGYALALDSSHQPATAGARDRYDGKMVRRSFDKGLGKDAIPMVSSWASANQLVVWQEKVA